jgi:hypothetical protein
MPVGRSIRVPDWQQKSGATCKTKTVSIFYRISGFSGSCFEPETVAKEDAAKKPRRAKVGKGSL